MSFKVVIERDGEHDYMRFDFPEESDRMAACSKLAQFAQIDGESFAHEHDASYVRDILFGASMLHLYEIVTVVGEPAQFVFKDSRYQKDEEKILRMSLTRVGEQRVEIIFRE